MANVKISALPVATTPLNGAEVAPIVQGGVTKQATVAQIVEQPVVATGSTVPRSLTDRLADMYYPDDFASLAAAVAGALAAGNPLCLRPGDNATINVPAQVATISAALSGIQSWSIPAGATLTIKVADGTYSLTSSIQIVHPDGARLRIEGNTSNPALCVLQATTENDILYVPPGYVLGDSSSGFNGFRLVKTGTNTRIGILTDAGSMTIGPKIEVNNFYYGIAARNGGFIQVLGTSVSNRVLVTNAGDVGIWAFTGSTINCPYARVESVSDVTNNLGFGILAEYSSSINAQYAYATNCLRAGIASFTSSAVRAYDTTTTANTGSGYEAAAASSLIAHGGTSTDNGGWGTVQYDTSFVDANPAITYSGNVLGNLRPCILMDFSAQARLSVSGGGTNEPFRLDAKGTGGFFFNGGGGLLFEILDTASSVNRVAVRPSATGNSVGVEPLGTDTDIGLYLATKGSGTFEVRTGNGISFASLANTSANSYILARARSGDRPQFEVISTLTDCDLGLSPKGAGVVRFGTHVGTADAPVNGYVTIRDAGGTLRRLATVA
jgi:hypothetical protein